MGALGKASGKLILFGEHAAVYGYPAVGVSLPEETTVRLEDVPPAGRVQDSPPGAERGDIAELLARMWKTVQPEGPHPGFSVHIESSVPRGVGFGSSAALCVALARSLLAVAGYKRDRTEIEQAWTLAHEGERFFHGTPSGVDTGISALGGTVVLRPRPPGLPEFERLPATALHLVAGAVRREEDTAFHVGGIASRIRSGDSAARSCIDELGEISAEAVVLLRSGHPPADELGKLAAAAMARLRKLGLSTPGLEAVLDAAQRAGALGSKLSGAGGGGAFYAIAPDSESASSVADRIESAARTAGIELVGGLRVVHT
jgi:mevalonate kinase